MLARTRKAAFLVLMTASPLWAEGFSARTELGFGAAQADASSIEADLGYQNAQAFGGGLRLMWDASAGPFRYEAHATVNAVSGSQVALALDTATEVGPPQTLLNLSEAWSPDPSTLLLGGVDRASVTYVTQNLVVKVGRQAITLGSGLFFHPSDIVAPFSPNAIDTSYKPGVDMLYGQYLFESGADVQAILVPRAETSGGPISRNSSTVAIRVSASGGELDGAVFLARDRDDSAAGLNLSGPLGGASWNGEYVHWQLANGATHPSWLFNISSFTTLGDWNVSYFAEYFHNGFGVSAATAFDALPASLTKRLATGQVFLGGREFLALGGQIQMTADFAVSPSAIVSLNDHSALAGIGFTYTLGDNSDLSFNYFRPIGRDGTEFGGRETTTGSGLYAGPTQSVNLRLVKFF